MEISIWLISLVVVLAIIFFFVTFPNKKIVRLSEWENEANNILVKSGYGSIIKPRIIKSTINYVNGKCNKDGKVISAIIHLKIEATNGPIFYNEIKKSLINELAKIIQLEHKDIPLYNIMEKLSYSAVKANYDPFLVK